MRLLFALFLIVSSPATLASDACWQQAALESGTTIELLQAIAWTESSMQSHAVNVAHERVTGTRDVGLVGVNTAPGVLLRLGLSEADLLDPCTNLRAGARILREKFDRYGVTWEAVGAYNASCTRLKGPACQAARTAYAWRVYRAMHGRRRVSEQGRGSRLRPDGVPFEPITQFVSLQ
ncbi:hypothetical protein RugamoR57_49050 [Duganella caerulea]|uniref:lytic transglycosylase domain-containing protein n=1 Tax=Duganella caerulea TaxID=2885762 RepID=UPI0030EA6138